MYVLSSSCGRGNFSDSWLMARPAIKLSLWLGLLSLSAFTIPWLALVRGFIFIFSPLSPPLFSFSPPFSSFPFLPPPLQVYLNKTVNLKENYLGFIFLKLFLFFYSLYVYVCTGYMHLRAVAGGDQRHWILMELQL